MSKYFWLIGLMFLTACSSSDSEPSDDLNSVQQEDVQSADDTSKEVSELSLSDTLRFMGQWESLYTAAQEGDYKSIQEWIHPDIGCYFIYRPGSHLFYRQVMNLDSGLRMVSYAVEELARTIASAPVAFEDWPTFVDCGYDGFSKDGAFAVKSGESNYLQSLAEVHRKEYDIALGPEESHWIADMDARVHFSVIWTEPSLVIHFIEVEGRWYFGIINQGRFDCS